jgi:hypothetical protein
VAAWTVAHCRSEDDLDRAKMNHKIAHLSRDLACVWRKEAPRIDAQTVEVTIKAHLRHMRERLERVALIAKVADSCPERGDAARGIEVALDLQELVYEVRPA